MDRKWVIIPDWNHLEESITIANTYNAAFEYNDFFYSDVYMDDGEICRRIKKYLSLGRDTSMDTVHGVFFDIAPTSMDPIIKSHSLGLMNQSMSIAKRLGCIGVVFHTSLISGLKLKSYQNGWLLGMETVFRELCKKYPMLTIYLENTTEQEPTLFIALIKRMKDVPNFKLCLDYAHANLTTTSLEVWCKEFSSYIGHIHLNDNDGIEDLHLACGTGTMDYSKFMQLSNQYFKDSPILLEVSGNAKAKQSLQYMNALGGNDEKKD